MGGESELVTERARASEEEAARGEGAAVSKRKKAGHDRESAGDKRGTTSGLRSARRPDSVFRRGDPGTLARPAIGAQTGALSGLSRHTLRAQAARTTTHGRTEPPRFGSAGSGAAPLRAGAGHRRLRSHARTPASVLLLCDQLREGSDRPGRRSARSAQEATVTGILTLPGERTDDGIA